MVHHYSPRFEIYGKIGMDSGVKEKIQRHYVDSDLTNKNIKMSSFKSSENIQKKEGGPDRSVSDNQSSSVTLNELAMKARKIL